jgi:hypothetical protein
LNSPGQNPLMREIPGCRTADQEFRSAVGGGGSLRAANARSPAIEQDVGIIDNKSAVIRGSEVHRGPVWPWRSDPEQLLRIYILRPSAAK